MTKEEKQLLLKDLCARLPYGIIVHIHDIDVDDYDRQLIGEDLDFIELDRRNCKPYLRPLSSMTEEEIKEFRKNSDFEEREAYEVRANGENKIVILQADCDLSVTELDWLNSHHFDYRGLIEKGLALEAPEGMYKN